VPPPTLPPQDDRWQLAAEAITLRVRWFGLAVGYVLVNFVGRETSQSVLNGILTLGAVYALIDTLWSARGKVFLSDSPLVISLMEAVFIGLLCHFDYGTDSAFNSPFRFYYFLSLLVCALRYPPQITYATFALHAVSFSTLTARPSLWDWKNPPDVTTFLMTLIFMGWVTWASTALATLIRSAGRRLSQLNEELQQNQALLERRIEERTSELQQSQALLVQQEKQAAFGLLAAGIAHEVGNPLAAISSLVQMLNRRHDDGYTRERLQMVDDQLRRIQRTLRELVSFSRPATTARSLCDIHEVIDAALNIAKYYKRKKGKRIVTRFADGLPKLRIVRDQVVQVFLNLVLNAMDATADGGTVAISTSLREGWLEVDVTDDGHGIAPADRHKIFHPYFTTKPTGTGLGLFVCRNILEQSGEGRIELAATSGEGTTFTVYLSCDNVRQHPDVLPATVESTEEVHAS
jgi:two-component system, NtrC family, sensor kinase